MALPIADASWVTLGQCHCNDAVYPPTSFGKGFDHDLWHVDIDGPTNPVRVYSSTPISRTLRYDFFIEQRISSTGHSDVLKIRINGANVVDRAGSLFPHGRQGGYRKYGIYRGYRVNETLAVRYANMEVADKAVTDLSSCIVAPLPHP